MKTKLLLSLFIGCLYTANAWSQSVIWSENFNVYPDGTNFLNEPSNKWWTDAGDCDDGGINNDATNYWGVYNGEFRINDIEGKTCSCGSGGINDNFWYSEQIDVSNYPSFTISIKGRAVGDMECGGSCNAADMLDASYQLDGGPWVSFFAMCGATNGTVSAGCIQVGNAQSLRIRVQAGTQANGETYYFDDISVLASPEITASTTSISTGTNTTFSISSTGGTWSSSNSHIATVDQTGKVSGTGIGTATIYYQLPSGCSVSKNITITSCTPPTLSVTNGSRCGSGSVSLEATASAGTVYWYSSASSTTALASGNSFSTPSLSSTTSYYALAKDGSCSSARQAVSATVYSNPSISGVSSLYESESATLQANSSAASSSAWTSSNSAVATIDDSGLLSAIAVGSTHINFTDNHNCQASSTITVNAPTVNLSYANNSVCNNSNSLLLPTLSGTGSFSGGTYSANNGLSIDPTTGAVNPENASEGLYVISYQKAYSGGTILCAAAITIWATPSLTDISSTCVPNQALYSISGTLSSGSISSSLGSISQQGNSFTVSGINSAYNTTLTASENGCTNTQTVNAPSCYTCPNIAAPISLGDKSYCAGSGIPSLSVQTVGGLSIDWYDTATNGNLLLANSAVFTPTQAGTYYAEARNAASCISTRTAVKVSEIALPTVTTANTVVLCDKGSANLQAQTSNGSISWYEQAVGGTAIASGNSFSTPILTENKTYYAEANYLACLSKREKLEVEIVSSPKISNFEIENRNNLNITLTNGTAPYAYLLDNNQSENILFDNLSIALNGGEHKIIITDENKCSVDTSFVISDKPKLKPEVVFTPNQDGINDYWDIENIELFPKTEVYIHNRFGKQLKAYKGSEFSPWDGMYLGSPAPSEDYWYILVVRDTGERITGHFTLKR